MCASPPQTYKTSTGDVVTLSIFSATNPAPSPPASLPTTTLPPLIYHITVEGLTTPTAPYALLTTTLNLSSQLVTEIASIGGFYLHIPRPRASPRAVRGSLDTLHAPLPLAAKVYVRLHLHPKRYEARDYAVLHADDRVLAVHKPADLPVCAGVDNRVECLTSLTGAFVTTRLDVGTSGVVLLARDKGSVREINKELQTADKYYIVFVEMRGSDTMGAGSWRDWYRSKPALGRGERPPILRRFEEGPREGWVPAQLEVVTWRKLEGVRSVAVVRLCTGRTHQIRLQMAARGYWVVGDTKYEGCVGAVYGECVVGGDARRLGLHCWLVKCGRWWSADLRRRKDLVQLVDEDEGFWEWLNGVEQSLRRQGQGK